MKSNHKCLISFISSVCIILLLQSHCFSVSKSHFTSDMIVKFNHSIPVLMYHSITDKTKNDACVSPKVFEQQISYLKKQGYTTISFKDLDNSINCCKTKPNKRNVFQNNGILTFNVLPKKPIIITFDDGYEDNYTNAYRILKKYKMKATINLICSMIGKHGGNLKFLTSKEIKIMHQSGLIEFGCHTYALHSVNLLHPLKNESNNKYFSRLYNDFKKSKRVLDNTCKIKTNIMAFPYGNSNFTIFKASVKAGFSNIITVNDGTIKYLNDLWRIPRVYVSNIYSPEKLIQKINAKNTVDSEETLYSIAYKYFFNHKYANAINTCNTILASDEENFEAYNIKGIAQCFNGDFNSGMSNINKALDLDSTYGYARFNKGLAYELYGHFSQSLTSYDYALKIEPYVWSYYGKASIYARLRKLKLAITNLSTAIKLNPFVKTAAKTEKDFNNIRNTLEFKKLIGIQ